MTVEGRLAHLEGRVVEHSQMFGLIEGRLTALDHKLDQKLTAFDQKFEQRLLVLEQSLSGQIRVCEEKYAVEISALRRDMASQFRWTTGMFLTGFVAMLAAILAR